MALKKGVKPLSETHPYLAAQINPRDNHGLTANDISAGSCQKIIWNQLYFDHDLKKWFRFKWESTVKNRIRGNNCPFLSGRQTFKGFNDLLTKRPDIAKQWHPTKNQSLTPDMVTPGSQQKVWWLLPYDDPQTGKHFDFEWETTVAKRTQGCGCPFLASGKVYKGFNDLLTLYPDVAAEWHPTKNNGLTPSDVPSSSMQKVWWLLPYDDPDTGKHFDFEWEATIHSRTGTKRSGCPFLANQAVFKGFNDLNTVHPELAIEWHPFRNGALTPCDVTRASSKKVWWFLPYDDPRTGKHFDFEWEATVAKRTAGYGCPFISGRKVLKGFNDLLTLYPNIAAEWHPTKNGKLIPADVTPGCNQKVWWICSCGHEWEAFISNRTQGHGCPICKESKGEKKISNFLEKRNVSFESEYTFDDCKYKGKLRFDRAVFYHNGKLACLVEYDGEQHYKPVNFSGKGSGITHLQITQLRDKIKTDYCRERRIPLVRISYKDYDNIERILLKKLIRYNLVA